MSKTLFVASLPYDTQKATLEALFAKIGKVESVNVIIDHISGHSKGYGFVEMQTDQDAEIAIEKLNGLAVGQRTIFVSAARPKTDKFASKYQTETVPNKPLTSGSSNEFNNKRFV